MTTVKKYYKFKVFNDSPLIEKASPLVREYTKRQVRHLYDTVPTNIPLIEQEVIVTRLSGKEGSVCVVLTGSHAGKRCIFLGIDKETQKAVLCLPVQEQDFLPNPLGLDLVEGFGIMLFNPRELLLTSTPMIDVSPVKEKTYNFDEEGMTSDSETEQCVLAGLGKVQYMTTYLYTPFSMDENYNSIKI